MNATLSRRSALAGLGAATLAGCQDPPMTASRTPRLEMDRLNHETAKIARRAAPGRLGVALINLESGEHFSFAGDQRFPLGGAAALPVAAAVLAEADSGRLTLSETVTLDAQQLSAPPSPIAAAWPARRDYTMDQLVEAAVAGDATALDVVMRRIGGPGAVSAWLDAKRVEELRVDRYAREIDVEAHGLPSFRPEWRTEGAFAQALAMQPQEARLAAMRRYMADPRDSATPRGLLQFLNLLNQGQLLEPASTRRLVSLMFQGRPRLARPDLGIQPAAASVGFFAVEDRRSYALAALVSGAHNSSAPAVLAEVADLARTSVG